MYKQKKAFTLIELIVVIIIFSILGTIAFMLMDGYSKNTRDSTRISDMSKIKTSLELFHLDSGKYPAPSGAEPITYSGGLAWYQGLFGNSTFTNVEKLNRIPKDPLTDKKYTYSVLNTKQEYEIAGIFEGDSVTLNFKLANQSNAEEKTAIAKVIGTYNGVSLRINTNNTSYILAVPSIITSIELSDQINRQLEIIIPAKELVLDNFKNLPPNYIGSIYNSNKETTNEAFELIRNNSILNLLVYEGDVSILTPTELITRLQESYTGTTVASLLPTSELFNIDISSASLETMDRFGVNFINNNLGGNSQSRIYSTCDGISHNTTRSYYTNHTVSFPNTCDTLKLDLVCIDGKWYSGEIIVEISSYSSSCIEIGAINCEANSTFTGDTTNFYDVPTLNHNETQSFTSDVIGNNGIFSYGVDVTCLNGVLSNSSEILVNVSCDTGYYLDGNTCVMQWDGDIDTGYLFRDSNGVEQYPTNCSDLLSQSIWKNSFIGSPWNLNAFIDGIYFIKPDSNPAFKVYCDMTTDGGGWTLISYTKDTTSLGLYLDGNICSVYGENCRGDLKKIGADNLNTKNLNELMILQSNGKRVQIEIDINTPIYKTLVNGTNFDRDHYNSYIIYDNLFNRGGNIDNLGLRYFDTSSQSHWLANRSVNSTNRETYANHWDGNDSENDPVMDGVGYTTGNLSWDRNSHGFYVREKLELETWGGNGTLDNPWVKIGSLMNSCNDFRTSISENPTGNTWSDISGIGQDGVYRIYPVNDWNSLDVYCDMTNDGGGWTLVEKGDGSLWPNNGPLSFHDEWIAGSKIGDTPMPFSYNGGANNYLSTESINLIKTSKIRAYELDSATGNINKKMFWGNCQINHTAKVRENSLCHTCYSDSNLISLLYNSSYGKDNTNDDHEPRQLMCSPDGGRYWIHSRRINETNTHRGQGYSGTLGWGSTDSEIRVK